MITMLRFSSSIGLALVLVIQGPLMAQSSTAIAPSGLELGDLKAYRAALSDQTIATAQVTPIRRLFDQSSDLIGQRVSIEGRVTRRFSQPAVGEFPPLTESWISSPGGNVACIVHPALEQDATIRLGSFVHFTGIYLKRLQYQGSDQSRFAPMIVGGAPPILRQRSPSPSDQSDQLGRLWGRTDWIVGFIAGGLVLLLLATRMLRAPSRRMLDRAPPPNFLAPDEQPYNEQGPREPHGQER
jgi:hypothetical protein